MKLRIAKTFDFDAAHHLPLMPDGHKCRRPHGHTYRVEVVLEGEPDPRGLVMDYSEIAEAWAPVHALLDHRDLNEVSGLLNPTTENLVVWIWAHMLARLPQLWAIRVYESSSTYCELTRAMYPGEA